MNVPEWLAKMAVYCAIVFVFKVVFGLIAKNEKKSDDKDAEIDARLEAMNTIYRNNDRELYKAQGQLEARIGYMEGFAAGKREERNR